MANNPEDERNAMLDYGVEERPVLRRRDSSEYYREPPALSNVSASDVLIWIVSFFVILALFLWLVGRWLHAAFN